MSYNSVGEKSSSRLTGLKARYCRLCSFLESLGEHVFSWPLELLCVCACSVAQLCPTLCDLMGCSLSGSSVHGILQAGVVEWVAMPFSRGFPQARDETHISWGSCIGRWTLYHWATWEALRLLGAACIPWFPALFFHLQKQNSRSSFSHIWPFLSDPSFSASLFHYEGSLWLNWAHLDNPR